MRTRVSQKAFFLLLCGVVLALASFSSPRDSHAEELVPVSITPFKIVLNAKLRGELQDIQGIIHMSLNSGYHLDEYEVNFRIGEDLVAEAFAFRYCYIDDNFLASFDREEIQDYLIAEEIEGEVTAQVEGWFTETASDGSFHNTRDFSGYDLIEVFAPGMR